MKIAVAGSSGFVGQVVVDELQGLGCEVALLESPRLTTRSRLLCDLREEAASIVAEMTQYRELDGVHALINAAGLARPGSPLDDALVGANTLLPAVHALAAQKAGVQKFVHISSTAVYGSAPDIDEEATPEPASPYGKSKLLGETLLKAVFPEAIIYRPTSVHGHGRRITQAVARFARSPLSSVAGVGEAPTPQVLVQNVGAAATFLALHEAQPPHPVVHPWEGVTTASLLRSLSEGREPIHVPVTAARTIVVLLRAAGRVHPKLASNVRRLEMLWFGQQQAHGWLSYNGYAPRIEWSNCDLARPKRGTGNKS